MIPVTSQDTTPSSSRNFRFWTIYRGNLVKLTLRPERTLSITRRDRDDEGYSFSWLQYTMDHEGIHLDYQHGSRCCDGVFRQEGELFCPHAERRSLDASNDLEPAWEDVGRPRCHDSFAAAAGY